MKYIKNQDDYKKSNIENINEVFENDITWGGSLLGRVINSTINYAIRNYITHFTGINKRVNDLKLELMSLTGYYMDSDDKMVKVKAILEKIRESVYNGSPVSYFLGKNTSQNPGLIKETIDVVDSLDDDFEDKDIIKQKLINFRKELEKLIKDGVLSMDDSIDDNQNKSTSDGSNIDDNQNDDNQNYDNNQDDNKEKSKKHSIEFLRKSLITLLGKDILEIPVKYTDSYFDLMLKGDYSYLDKDSIKKDVYLVNYRNMLTDNNFLEYLKKNNDVVYQIIMKMLNKTSSDSDKNDNITKTRIPEINYSIDLPDSYSESLMFLLEGIQQDTIMSTIKNSGRLISEAVNTYLKNTHFDNRKRLRDLFYNGQSENVNKTIEFKLVDTDTLENVCFSLATINQETFSKYKKENPNYKYEDMFTTILRNKINQVGNNIVLDNSDERKFNNWVNAIINKNKINENYIFELFNSLNEDVARAVSDIVKAWKKFFTENEEKKWCLTLVEANKKAKEFDRKNVDINTKSPDPIIKICNLFGRAYKDYSTDYIPSGRPDGKVSLKTFRKYRYIGSGNPGTPSNPGYGPWAIIGAYDKWRKGVMRLLEDVELRDVLANKNLTINGNKGAGVHLMKFINDMLTHVKGDYDEKRHELLKNYFNINITENDKRFLNTNTSMSKEEKKESNTVTNETLRWEAIKDVSMMNLDSNFKHSFLLLEGRNLEGELRNYYYSTYIYEYDSTYKAFLFKFESKTANLPNYYLKDTGRKIEQLKNYPIKNDDKKKYYIGLIEMNTKSTIEVGDEITLKFISLNDKMEKRNVKSHKMKIDRLVSLMDNKKVYKLDASVNKDLPINDKLITPINYIKLMTQK